MHAGTYITVDGFQGTYMVVRYIYIFGYGSHVNLYVIRMLYMIVLGTHMECNVGLKNTLA